MNILLLLIIAVSVSGYDVVNNGQIVGYYKNSSTAYTSNSSSLYGNIVNADFQCRLSSLGSIIRLHKLKTFSAKQSADIEKAHCIWETVIRGVKVNGYPGVDIDVNISNIDGAGGVLGQAYWRYANYYTGPSGTYAMPISGYFEIDAGDLAVMSIGNDFMNVITHEIGHILGINSQIWGYNNLLGANQYQYNGTSGLNSFRKLYNRSFDSYVPIETHGGGGTAGSHWDETTSIIDVANRTMALEIMTGYLSSINYMTALTSHSMCDLGYEVNSAICAVDSDCGHGNGSICNRGYIDMCSTSSAVTSNPVFHLIVILGTMSFMFV